MPTPTCSRARATTRARHRWRCRRRHRRPGPQLSCTYSDLSTFALPVRSPAIDASSNCYQRRFPCTPSNTRPGRARPGPARTAGRRVPAGPARSPALPAMRPATAQARTDRRSIGRCDGATRPGRAVPGGRRHRVPVRLLDQPHPRCQDRGAGGRHRPARASCHGGESPRPARFGRDAVGNHPDRPGPGRGGRLGGGVVRAGPAAGRSAAGALPDQPGGAGTGLLPGHPPDPAGPSAGQQPTPAGPRTAHWRSPPPCPSATSRSG